MPLLLDSICSSSASSSSANCSSSGRSSSLCRRFLTAGMGWFPSISGGRRGRTHALDPRSSRRRWEYLHGLRTPAGTVRDAGENLPMEDHGLTAEQKAWVYEQLASGVSRDELSARLRRMGDLIA